ncbi:MAG: hypothetical protein ABI400_12330 [Lacisediminihabitans sp.]
MKSIHVATVTAFVLATAALTGCSALTPNPPGTQPSSTGGPTSSGSNSGGSAPSSTGGAVTGDGSKTKVDCAPFAAAVAALFPQGVSSPLLLTPETCVWGVGSNATATSDVLSQSFNDVFTMYFSYGDDAELQYKGDDGEVTGGAANLTKIGGVGAAASFYDGGTGLPQVSAWSGKVACGTHLFIADASTVGLTATGDSNRIVAAADEGGLAKKIAEICAVGWKG